MFMRYVIGAMLALSLFAPSAQAGIFDSFKKWATGSGTDVFEVRISTFDQEKKLESDPDGGVNFVILNELMASYYDKTNNGKWRCDLRKEASRICRLPLSTRVPYNAGLAWAELDAKFDLVIQGYERSPDEYDIYFVPKDSAELVSADRLKDFGLTFNHTKGNPLRTTRDKMLDKKSDHQLGITFAFKENVRAEPIVRDLAIDISFKEID